MGFRDFHCQNLAHLSDQAWRLINNPEALWTQILKAILKAIYYPKPRNYSWMWNNILEGRDFIKKNGRWAIAKGNKVDAWRDNWLWNGDSLQGYNNGESIMVSDLIDPTTRKWNTANIAALLPRGQAFKVVQTPKGLIEDNDKFF